MMQPKRTKYRKQMKGRNRGLALTGNKVSFGEFGMKSTELGRISARQIEAARRVITRYVARGGKLWIRIFPDTPVTKKPLEVRMGSGKGNPEGWVAVVLAGRILFEMGGVDRALAIEALTVAAQKLPIRTKICEVSDNG
jgi:large subunit ribosomal protein L16